MNTLQTPPHQLRIYSYDYNLDVSALRTFISINDVKNQLPAILVDGEVYYGFQSEEDIMNNVPEIAKLEMASTTATSSATSTKR